MSEHFEGYSSESKPGKTTLRIRIALYILLTVVIQAICWFFILNLSIENPQRIVFYYISYNIGLLIFPLGYGIILTGLFGWVTGIISMFFITYLIGETANKLVSRRNRPLQRGDITGKSPFAPDAANVISSLVFPLLFSFLRSG